ncbi:MAG: MaoC/PaaZ C-terminal domain-containing protein, partial [Geminicoccaceae bacterium]
MSLHVKVGHEVSFSKTVGETDVYMFAGITGDLSPNHVDAVYMAKSSYGQRMAHGALLIGYMSTTSTMAIAHVRAVDETPVSLGYDR